ncbi:cyclase dehydrase [uncultured Enterovirga sp.]|uniref:cyclase dehydrase n=1 Tax=uncultured Enterovirga sp. TaxID=2026352 RepID=UPI0035CC16B3
MSHKPSTLPTRGPSGRGAHSGSETLAKGLGWFSIGLGLAELIAPRAICRTLGMDGQENLVRAYGVRELATGVAILMSHDPTPWIYGRIGGDALDLATLGANFQGDNPEKDNLTIATVAVAGITLLDIACVHGLTSDKRLSSPGEFDYGDRSGFPLPPRAMRGAASDLDMPADFRIPETLRPWQDGRPATG